MTTAQIEAKKANLTARILKAAAKGDQLRVEDFIEEIWELGRQDARDDMLLDLVDTGEITPEGVSFAVENYGCTAPRR